LLRGDWVEAPPGMAPVPGGILAPPGFVAGSAACGLKPSGALDVGLLAATGECASAMVTTTSALPAAPIIRNRDRVDPARVRAVVVNSGTANAATGSPGVEDAEAMAERAAAALGIDAREVVVSSTGTIGDRLDRERVLGGIDAAARGRGREGGEGFARAIQTTDRFDKAGAFSLALPSGAGVTFGVAAKGAGMIRPGMATMLAYLTTDAPLAAADLAAATRAAGADAFNRISVDGQMSPSDTLLVMASGAGAPLAGEDLAAFARGLRAVCRWAALLIVKDGEGAEFVVRLVVDGAADPGEAEAVGRAIADSPLVRTAVHGRDPNWGRVSQAVGQALAGRGGPPATLAIAADGVSIDDPAVAEVMARPEYELGVSLGRGDARAELFFCDLGHAYITLNAEYTT
jgi:glutamate N-acetyltransferase/amino-acid N-acetyltransferase